MSVHTDSGHAGPRQAGSPPAGRPAEARHALPRQQVASPLGSGADRPAQLRRQSFTPVQVEQALRLLPSHGWTSGWTGRRDRALIVLSQMAGLSYANIAELTVADVTITDGSATIKTPGGTTTLRMTDDTLICGPCALARWLHALDMTALYPTGRVIAAVIARAAPLTAQSPHLCQGTLTVTEATGAMSLLSALSQPVPASSRTISVRHAAPAHPGSMSLSLTPPGDKNPAKRTVTVITKGALGAKLSDYARADLDSGAKASGDLADGLEGRARQLLEHRLSDVAGF